MADCKRMRIFANMKHRMLHIVIIALLMLIALAPSASADYTDHRGRKVDSLQAVLRSGTKLTDEQLANIYKDLMWGLLNKDGQQATDYAKRLVSLSYSHNWLNVRADALRIMGLHAYGSDRYQEAEHYFLQALAVTDSMRNDGKYDKGTIDDNLSTLYGSLGNLYNIQDKALLAIEYYQRALPIFERHQWRESQALLYHNVAELYLSMGNLKEAERNYLLAILQGMASGDSLLVAVPQKGLAKVYIDQGDYKQAYQTATAAYQYYHNHKDEDTGDYAEVLASMVKTHLMKGHEDLPQAKALAQEAVRLAQSHEMMGEVRYDVYAAAATVEMQQQNWPQALDYALQSIHQDDQAATFSDVGCYELLANIYMQLGQKDKASLYINKVRAMMERFATSHFQSGLSQMEVIYQTKKKEEAIRQLTRQKHWYMAGTALIGLSLLLTALLFYLYWRSSQLRKRHQLTLAKLEGEQAERIRLARDLHDRLGGLLTIIKLDHQDDPHVDEAIREMRNVAHHLLPDALSRYGLRVALRDYCQTMRNVTFAFTGREQHVAHEEAVYCIVYELVNNAVKNAQAQHIDVQLLIDNHLTAISVSDDGNGLTTADPPAGSGLRNIRERVEALGGTFRLQASPQKGTEVSIELPATARNHQK